jgi:hypothetical protein
MSASVIISIPSPLPYFSQVLILKKIKSIVLYQITSADSKRVAGGVSSQVSKELRPNETRLATTGAEGTTPTVRNAA